MARHIAAHLGGILAAALDQRAGMVFHARFGSLGLGVTHQNQAAHGSLYGVSE